MKKNFPFLFLIAALLALVIGALAGVLISMSYIFPDFMEQTIAFNRLRPIHTTSVIAWIVLAATGGLYFYIYDEHNIFSYRLGVFHFLLFFVLGIGILLALVSGNMGGREYLVFSPGLLIPVLLGWMLFGYNFYKTLLVNVRNWPVYYWMWGTGIVFMIYHLSEANFWWMDGIRRDYIKDVSIQWKSYGSFVGSWNMLVYGTAIYVMEKIRGEINPGRGRTVFFFYFLGLTNLMFGWAHHTYIIPMQPWVRYVAYAVSMTEWIIFIKIVRSWRKSLSVEQKFKHSMAYLFIRASDRWVFLNLTLALLMSIPVINYFTHGTHITVAHSMGTTIGINTMILFGSLSYILTLKNRDCSGRRMRFSYYFLNTSLLLFWGCMIYMGIYKAVWLGENPGGSFILLHQELIWSYVVFVVSGIAVALSLIATAGQMMGKMLPFFTYILLPKGVQKEMDRLEEAN